MKKRIKMPKMGLTMTEGTIVKWLKKEGELVNEGESLLVIESDKATLEVTSDTAGVLGRILAGPKQRLPVGATLALLVTEGETITEEDVEDDKKEQQVREEITAESPTPPAVRSSGRASRGVAPVSPLARRLAEEHGVNLTCLVGSGPGGRIVKEDVMREIEHLRENAARPDLGTGEDKFLVPSFTRCSLSQVKKITGERMSASFRDAPHFYLETEAQVGRLLELRGILNRGQRVSITSVLAKMVGYCLRRHPHLNASYDPNGEYIKVYDDVNICLAVATDSGLVVPVIRKVDRKSIRQVDSEARELVERARAGRLVPDDFVGGTFTVSNLGMYGVDSFVAIINPPQAAILSVGRIRDALMLQEEKLSKVQVMKITLSVDHRVVDGAEAAAFMGELRRTIEEPLVLLDD